MGSLAGKQIHTKMTARKGLTKGVLEVIPSTRSWPVTDG